MNCRNRVLRMTLSVACLVGAIGLAGAASISFPSNPSSIAECDRAKEAGLAVVREHEERRNEFYRRSKAAAKRNWDNCTQTYGFGSKWKQCMDSGGSEDRRLHQAGEEAHQASRRASDQVHRLNSACHQTAQAHIQQERLQRDAAERSRREAESRQRQTNEAMQRQQRDQQSDQNRREREIAQAKSDALRRQQAVELERANRSQPRAPESSVIYQAPPSYLDRTPGPRIVQTPQMQQQAQAEAEQQRKIQAAEAAEQEARILRSLGKQLIGSATATAGAQLNESSNSYAQEIGKKGATEGKKMGAQARTDILDGAFNPNGDSDPNVNQSVKSANELSKRAENTPLSNRIAGQMQRDAIAGIGSNANRASGDYGRVMTENDRANSIPPPASSGRPGGQSVPFTPMIGSDATSKSAGIPDQSATNGAIPKSLPTPLKMCVTLAVSEREQCMIDLCGSEKWRSHNDCVSERR